MLAKRKKKKNIICLYPVICTSLPNLTLLEESKQRHNPVILITMKGENGQETEKYNIIAAASPFHSYQAPTRQWKKNAIQNWWNFLFSESPKLLPVQIHQTFDIVPNHCEDGHCR